MEENTNSTSTEGSASPVQETVAAPSSLQKPQREPIISRRSLCLGIGGAVALMALGATSAFADVPAVRPPGGTSASITSACIRCAKCYEACPNQVIVPSPIENGLIQTRTPMLSFNDGWCDFCAEANGGWPLCVQSCPTDALSLDAAPDESTILGKAAITKDWCLAYRLIGCKECYDACPIGAIELDTQGRPVVNEGACNGCGACEAACVSLVNGSISEGATARAITVQPV